MSTSVEIPSRHRPSWGTVALASRSILDRVIQELETRQHLRQDEELNVLAWRIWVLDRAGYDEGDAVLLASLRDVDLHLAVDLLERGCPPQTALQILL